MLNDLQHASQVATTATHAGETEPLSLAEVKHRYIVWVLERLAGNKTQAARVLRVDRKTLGAKLARYQRRLQAQ